MTNRRTNKTFQHLYCTGLCMLLILSGCAVNVPSAGITQVDLPLAFSESGSKGLAGQWWLAFNDLQLNELIEKAVDQNFSLKSSLDRLSQADAIYRKSNAGLLPTLDGDGSALHSIVGSDGSTVKSDKVLLGLSTSYEIDLWGRIESGVQASRLDMETSKADLDTAAMTIAAEVAKIWYLLVQQTMSLQLLEEQIQTNTIGLDLISAQHRTGQVPLVDVLQQRQLIEYQNGQKMLLLANISQSDNQLSILLGEVPGNEKFTIPSELIAVPALPSTGVPSELINARPDIRSSLLALEAADKRVAVAVADRYPSLRITATNETFQGTASIMFTDYLASIMAGLTAPLFDGGARKAEVERTKAVATEKLHSYAQTILTAFGEVEDALYSEKQQQFYIESLQTQLDLAKSTLAQVKDRYLKGVENYQRVLTALTSLQALQQNELTANKDLLVNRIELYRVLGQGWDYSMVHNNS